MTMYPPRLRRVAGQAPQFDLASALTKKETRVIRKAEYMIPYHMARCPNYGWKESPEYARAKELKEKIAAIGAPLPSRGVERLSKSLGVRRLGRGISTLQAKAHR